MIKRRRNPEVCARCSQGEADSMQSVVTDDGESDWCAQCVEDHAYECHKCSSSVDEALKAVEVLASRGTKTHDWCPQCAEDHAIICQRCDKFMDKEIVRVVGGDSWCPDCYDEDAFMCEHCDESYPLGADSSVHTRRRVTQTWCEDCDREQSWACEHCADHSSEDVPSFLVDGEQWCTSCAESGAIYCENCDEYSTDPHDHDDKSELIKDYHAHKGDVDFIMSGWVKEQPKPLYFGVELEVEVPSGKDREEFAEKVQSSMGALLLGLEEDGSLSHGFEIITQPAGLDVHRQTWCDVSLKGLKSHDTTTCGLHVHFSKNAVSKTTVGKMMVFIHDDHNRKFMELVTRRTFSQAARYAKHVENVTIMSGAKSRSDRYEALNLVPHKTVEFRMPKGTTKRTTILATLEFLYMLIRFAEASSMKGMTVERFKMFVVDSTWTKETRFLRAYLVDRGLATAKEMNLPKLKPGIAPASETDTAEVRENPPRRNPSSYAEQALAEYLATGE